MKTRKTGKKILVILLLLSLISGSLYFFFSRDNTLVENVKKTTAVLLKKEYIPDQTLPFESRLVMHKKDSVYQNFRNKYRFHYQMLGLYSFEDSSRLIVISEPPPYFDLDTIKSVFAKFTHGIETRSHKIGYDGRITDVLISVNNATSENLEHLIADLNKLLFLSDYKPFAENLDSLEKRTYFSDNNLDYQITLYEFNDWFIENNEQFIQLHDTVTTETIASIMQEKKRGVYFSRLPGFVAWAISKKSDLSEQLQHIRQFTLDADLVLGALSDSATLVIIGREREATLQELPPLNVETILLLASITEKELSQSLDINDFLAGKMKDGRDWCPTYLSKELENTEFGHLLTITDVLLKDWSEKGTIKEAYYRYPKPGYYPFDKPLFRKLGLNELVYNWNTANTMYAIDLNDITIYTLNRTGSLPVSYFHSQERSTSVGRKYENQAFSYFANSGNTDLARVVQYTALYQLFIDNEITYSGDIHSAFPANKPYLLKKPTEALLTFLKEMTPQQIELLSDTLSALKFSDYQKEKVDEQLADNEKKYNFIYSDTQKESIYKDVQKNAKDKLSGELKQARTMLNGLSEDDFTKLARYLSYPRGVRINNRERYAIMLKGKKMNELLHVIGKNYLYLIDFDLAKIKDYYVANLSKTSAPYVKTPSVIITFNDFLTTGGHNLSSKINRVNSLTNYKSSSSGSPKPSTSKPQTTSQPKSTTSPQAKSTTPSSGSKPSPKASTGSKPASTQTMTKPATRPRSEVIPSTNRVQRGF